MAQFKSLFVHAPAAETVTGQSPDIASQGIDGVAVDINVTAMSGTSPTLTASIQRKGADGVWYTIWTGTAIAANGSQSVTIGAGCEVNKALPNMLRLVWTLGGTTHNITFSASVQGF